MAHPGDGLGPTDGLVYHYTKASTALEHVLHEMKIRLGPAHDTNDPWEARTHSVWVGATPNGPEPEGPSVLHAAHDELERALRRARVACFSRDDPTEPDPERARTLARSTCGWARDRMWGQYADCHRGVCLCFDREKLLESFALVAAEHGDSIYGDVAYGDEQFETGMHKPNFDHAERHGPVRYARLFRRQTARHRYFAKRRDWEHEREWRLVLFDDCSTGPHVLVPIERALRAIVVGHRFNDAYHPCIAETCARLGIPAFKMMYSGRVSLSGTRYDLKPVRTLTL